MDSLSISPSLLNILSHVNHKDILSCSRVNRRIHDVISQNRRTLPRPWTEISFEFWNHEKKTTQVKVDLPINEEQNFFIVYERFTEFYDCEGASWMKWMVDHYESRYPASKKHNRGLSSIGYGIHQVQASFETASLEEGLTQLLSCIFDRFHFKLIEMTSVVTSPPVEWCKLISDLLKSSQSKCEKLQVDTWYPKEWNEIIKSFACRSLSVSTSSSRIALFLPSISIWNRELVFDIDTALWADSLPDIIAVVEKWQSGTIDINLLQVSPNSNKQYPLGITAKDVEKAVATRQSSIRYDTKYPNRPTIHVLFKRSKDDRILSLVFSQRRNELKLFDYTETKDKK